MHLHCSGIVNARAQATAVPLRSRRWVALAWLAFGLMTVFALAACRRGVPAIDTAPKTAAADATISGTVSGPAGVTPIDGRAVEAVNLDTGERQRATTNHAGGFSFKLKPGKYRVELALQSGESLVRQPDVIELNRTDADAHADFVVGTARVSRPKGPTYRLDDGLGSPIA